MKIVNRYTTGPLALLSSWLIRGWLGSLNYRFIVADESSFPEGEGHYIYLFWHENLLFPAFTHAGRGYAVLTSNHRDGELMTRILNMLGLSTVRGSSTRHGFTGLRGMMRQGKVNHLAITPDGPRGPRRVVKPGSVYLSCRNGMPIVPVGFSARKVKRAGSWDRMVLPWPGTTCYCAIGKPIHVPEQISTEQMEAFLAIMQAGLDEAQELAEAVAEGRRDCPPTLSLEQVHQTADRVRRGGRA